MKPRVTRSRNRSPAPILFENKNDVIEKIVRTLVAAKKCGIEACSGLILGMGAGWYDRSFAARLDRPAPPHLVGAAFSVQQADAIRPEAWDIPLDAVCTESDTFLVSP